MNEEENDHSQEPFSGSPSSLQANVGLRQVPSPDDGKKENRE